ncbi:MAG: hypothetical protein JO014_06510 [Metakosakonia sp.]|nr:hypothetical protein [Phytobacter sp.]MBV8872364.1 hypothetical protein [Phytobacter sp.]
MPEYLLLKHLVTELQIHLPAVSSGADHIDSWLLEPHLYRPLTTVLRGCGLSDLSVVSNSEIACHDEVATDYGITRGSAVL